MKYAFAFIFILGVAFLFFPTQYGVTPSKSGYDVYQYIKDCKTELGIEHELPALSCLNGKPLPIYVDNKEILQDNWQLLSGNKQCDNPHWLGGDMGCWTYSHFQTHQLDQDNVLVLNCRQKGNQLDKTWFRHSKANLGMDQYQRKKRFASAANVNKKEYYYLYNTFNDIGIILRNLKNGKSCYVTQYGEAVVGFLPPLDQPLPPKDEFLNRFSSEQAKPPKDFPEELWYRDANKAFKSPEFTASAGCVGCHNAHGFKYSPYINSKSGLPAIQTMAKLPYLPIGDPFIEFFNNKNIRQVTTDPIDGKPQLCTSCHNITTAGSCNYIDSATNHPSMVLSPWLTDSSRHNWMPPVDTDRALVKKHVAAIKCCCEHPDSTGCQTRKFGPKLSDLPEGFEQGKGWISGNAEGLCEGVIHSMQWDADHLSR